ncbi:MAG: aminopeptidase P N-terminal domain-containing protein [Gemmatimonadetes bacterium]|nr:aminopeptidase P N-terminal domain-containing protein [Gemmatimonadota bacterium]
MRLSRTLAWLALVVLAPSLEAQITSEEYAARRAALAERMGDGVVIAFGGREPVRHWPPFYQHPAFRYLTGFLESNAAFVMVRQGGRTASTLFVEQGNARTALYNGKRATLDEISERLGLEARYNDELHRYVESLIAEGLPVYFVPDVQSNEYSTSDSLTAGRNFLRGLVAAHPGLRVSERNQWVDELRAKKSDAEIALLKTAADISSRAHEAAMRAIRPGIRESEIQAVMEAEYRKLGADAPGYSSIVGSGPNSTVLHYPAGTRVAKAGEVVLLDVAAYYQGYSADITRTVPVDLTFSPDHRDVYEIVLAAQKAAERVIEPDAPRSAPTDAAYDVLKDGLVQLGLIESVDASFDAPSGLCPGAWANDDGTCPQWYLYVYHGFFHGIGLDVHDPSQFAMGDRRFQPGDVFTIEPGIYVREDVFEDLPDTPRNRALIAYSQASVDRYVNIGVRIEDNYVLTTDGLERISDVPREIDEIEALRARPVSE